MKNRWERGQALIETAIMLPLFLFGMYGIMYASNAGALWERAQLGVRYAGVLSAQSNPYLDYSLYTVYNNLNGNSFVPTQSCFTPPPESMQGGQLTTIPPTTGNITSNSNTHDFPAFWQPQSVNPSCDGGRQVFSAGTDLSRDYLMLRNGAAITSVPSIPAYVNAQVTGIDPSAKGNFFRSPDLASLLQCSAGIGDVVSASLRPGTDTTDPATPPVVLDSTIDSTIIPIDAQSCDATNIPQNPTPSPPPTPTPPPTAPPTAAPSGTPSPSPSPSPTASPSPSPSPTASPSRPPSSTIMLPYQMALVSPTLIGSKTWIWLPSSEKFGKTLMLTGSDPARSRSSKARSP